MNIDIDAYKSQYIQAVYDTGAFLIKKNPFTLRSGKMSHIYLNHRQFLTKSKYLTLMADAYNAKLKTVVDDYSLTIVDSIMSPIIAGAMSTIHDRNIVVVKSKKLQHGTQEAIYGNLEKECVIIDDMTSSGGTIIEAANKIRQQGGVVNYCMVSACRDRTASNNLAKHNIQLLFIASFAEIVNDLKPILSQQELAIINQEQPVI